MELCWMCGTYGGNGQVPAALRWRNVRIRDHLEALGLEGRIILK